MDAFLEEIKGRQNMGASSQLYSDQTPSSGSMDDGDPTSTNLYLGNLAPTVTEEALQVRKLCPKNGRVLSYRCRNW